MDQKKRKCDTETAIYRVCSRTHTPKHSPSSVIDVKAVGRKMVNNLFTRMDKFFSTNSFYDANKANFWLYVTLGTQYNSKGMTEYEFGNAAHDGMCWFNFYSNEQFYASNIPMAKKWFEKEEYDKIKTLGAEFEAITRVPVEISLLKNAFESKDEIYTDMLVQQVECMLNKVLSALPYYINKYK